MREKKVLSLFPIYKVIIEQKVIKKYYLLRTIKTVFTDDYTFQHVLLTFRIGSN